MTPKEALDKIFSKYIRLKHSDSNGYCRCYTCSTILPWNRMQNGHFVPRANIGTRWEEDNCRPQCQLCNEYKLGNLKVYRERLIKELGEERVEELEQNRWHETKFMPYEIEEMTREYRSKVNELLKQKVNGVHSC